MSCYLPGCRNVSTCGYKGPRCTDNVKGDARNCSTSMPICVLRSTGGCCNFSCGFSYDCNTCQRNNSSTQPRPSGEFSYPVSKVIILTLKALHYLCANHGDQRVFQFEIIINVSVSFSDSFEYLCYGSKAITNRI